MAPDETNFDYLTLGPALEFRIPKFDEKTRDSTVNVKFAFGLPI
jgi:hypothetical protein